MERVYFSVDDVAITFYERLGDALDAAGLNKKQLRERINADSRGPSVSAGSVSNWFNGVGALPNGENIKALCKALNVTPDYLLGYTDVPNYNVADAKAIKNAEAYTGLPRQALETLHRNEAYPFIAPSEAAAVEGFKPLGANRTATEVAHLLAQPDFLRALETMEDARAYRRALDAIDGQTLDADEARHTAETDYMYLKYAISTAIAKSLDAILEQG